MLSRRSKLARLRPLRVSSVAPPSEWPRPDPSKTCSSATSTHRIQTSHPTPYVKRSALLAPKVSRESRSMTLKTMRKLSRTSLKTLWCLNSIQVLLGLTVFPVIYKTFLVILRQLHEIVRSSHFLQGTHCIRSWSKCSELCQRVNENFKGLIFCALQLLFRNV